MSNYIVEDELENYNLPKPKKSVNYTKPIIIGIGVLVVMIFIIIVGSMVDSERTYTKIEKNMIEKAQEYILNNAVSFSDEVYLDANKIGVDLPVNCNVLSGVIYSNSEYKPYLLCSDYESNLLPEQAINIYGKNVVLLTKGQEYYELGHSENYNVQISGNVNTNNEGIYNVYYISQTNNNYAIRKVIVVDNPLAINYVPKINITGNNIELRVGQLYSENAVAIDSVDGVITDKIINIHNVNPNETGEYLSIYSVSNSLGYTTMVRQDVFVLSNAETTILTKLTNSNMTNETVGIDIKVSGDKYSYMVLPSGVETKDRTLVYDVEENGLYTFTAYSYDGNKVVKTVKVSNIDQTKPAGTCSVIAYSDHLVFSVKISTFNYIVGYNYHINNKTSGFIPNSTYNSKYVSTTNLSVTVMDYIGNKESIPCQVSQKKSSLEPNGYQKMINSSSRLRIPIEEALANRGHTVNDLNMCIYNKVKQEGPYTRYGVAAAAYGLIECTYNMTGYVLSYNHESGKVEGSYCQYNSDICGKLGINRRWGKKGGACNSDECWHGLNCATFVRWAMCNGGMDLCTKGEAGAYGMASKKYFPEADGVTLRGRNVTYYSGTNLTNISAEQLVRMIKPGDVLAQHRLSDNGSQHTYVVVGRDNEGIIAANDGYYMNKITYNKMLDGEYSYLILFLDKYYANPNNYNNLYK